MKTSVDAAYIVAGDFHADLADKMIAEATDQLRGAGVTSIETVRVAGCYEMPLVVDHLLRHKRPEILVVVGFIEKGETLHGEVMGHVVHAKLIDLQTQYATPIGIGLIGPGATVQQAAVRASRAARGAALAALRTFTTLEEVKR